MPEKYDLTSLDFATNRYAIYDQLRAQDPVYWNQELQAWIVTSYSDVAAGLKDNRFSVRRGNTHLPALPPDAQLEFQPLQDFYQTWMMYTDGQDHARIRQAVNKSFSVAAVNRLKPTFDTIVDQHISTIAEKQTLDLLHDLAHPLGMAVIGAILGIPEADYQNVLHWSNDLVSFLGSKTADPQVARSVQTSMFEFKSYLHDVLHTRRANPQHDLISQLITDTQAGLSDEDIFAIVSNILVDGHEPIANTIANGIAALLTHPNQRELLQRDPNLIPSAVEELLRFEPTFQYSARRATEDLTLHGETIRKDQRVLFMTAAANRDPQQFQHPDELNIQRIENKHFSFGFGAHYCLGGALGRAVVGTAIERLLTTFPNMQLANETVDWIPSLGYRAMTSLPIALNASR